MAYEPSIFRGTLDFLGRLGVYDIILPFMLIFTIVFAILEKTKIYGLEKIGGEEYTRKNLNAITGFIVAFLVVTSSQLVSLINETIAKAMVLLVLAVVFLILFGVFFGEKEDFFEDGIKSRRGLFFIIMFLGIVLVALSSYRFADGGSVLDYIYLSLWNLGSSTAVSAIVLVLIVIAFIWWTTGSPKPATKKSD